MGHNNRYNKKKHRNQKHGMGSFQNHFQQKGQGMGHQEGMGKFTQAFGGGKDIVADLRQKGFTIRSIVPDGNCLFRSCADQLFGDQNRHHEVRRNAIRYILSHKNDYLPFMDEDRQPFNSYVQHMSKNGTWGGDLEINAISNCYKCNVIVYQDRRPNIELLNFPENKHVLRLAYFGSCHYNSVRGKDHSVLSNESSPGTIVLKRDDKKPASSSSEVRQPRDEGRKQKDSSIDSKQNQLRQKLQMIKEQSVANSRDWLSGKGTFEQNRVGEITNKPRKSALYEKSEPTAQPHGDSREKSVHTISKLSAHTEEKKKERQEAIAKKIALSIPRMRREDVIARNLKIIRTMGKKFDLEQQHAHSHHHCHDKWCGDLPFDQLVSEEAMQRLQVFASEKQLRKTLKFLTMKCSCKSGSYFKYCCYPKMKVCINRNRYHISKYRV